MLDNFVLDMLNTIYKVFMPAVDRSIWGAFFKSSQTSTAIHSDMDGKERNDSIENIYMDQTTPPLSPKSAEVLKRRSDPQCVAATKAFIAQDTTDELNRSVIFEHPSEGQNNPTLMLNDDNYLQLDGHITENLPDEILRNLFTFAFDMSFMRL